MNNIKVGVIAGSPVDTQMGVDFLNSRGMIASSYPVAASSGDYELQLAHPVEITSKIRGMIQKIKSEGIATIMIYCNSLSSTVDFEELAKNGDVKIITPLMAYKEIAGHYKIVGVMAGNNQGLAGIERAIVSVNPDCKVIGLGMLPLVIEIEKKTAPKEIAKKLALKTVLEFYDKIGVDTIILGCTHFPYICSELKTNTVIPILDPAETMYKMLISYN